MHRRLTVVMSVIMKSAAHSFIRQKQGVIGFFMGFCCVTFAVIIQKFWCHLPITIALSYSLPDELPMDRTDSNGFFLK